MRAVAVALILLAAAGSALAGRTRPVPEGTACPRSDAPIDERGCPGGFWILPVPDGEEPPADACAEIRRLCGL